jgi:lipopolysaccharide export system protein LptA
LLLIDHAAEGSILTVHGWTNRPGEVHHEGTSLIGPWIKIDQVHNLAVIEGRGSMAVPATTDLAGNTLRQPEPIVIHFRDGMTFKGALRTAEFFGKVSVSQGDAGLTCHTMRVIFDRPVYFTSWRAEGGPSNTRSAPSRPNSVAAPSPAAESLRVPQGGAVAAAVPEREAPRIESVHCYPCPADSAEHFRETLVYFHQIDRDPQTGRLLRQQMLEAQELTLLAQARDHEQGAPYRFLEAHGPGVVRIWGLGVNETLGSSPLTAAEQSSAVSPPAEMQLTVVHFSRRMIAKDKGRTYREATFYDNVQLIHVPTEDPHLEIKRPELPPRAVLLTCQSRLVVWTYRRGTDPPRQHMHAYGNAYLQSEEYAGAGEVIKNDGKLVTFEGSGATPARIRRRYRGDEQTAQRIIYDRATQQFTVEGSLGGAILAPAPARNTPASNSTSRTLP